VRIVLQDAGVTLRPFRSEEFETLWREETHDRGAFETPWSDDDDRAKAKVRARVDHSGTWRDGRVLVSRSRSTAKW
jgi:hypothetical protein